MIKSKIRIAPRVIQHLGEDLITSPEVAVTELLKNSMDAKATEINIRLFDCVGDALKSKHLLSTLPDNLEDQICEVSKSVPVCIIEDNGFGMTPRVLDEAFLSIGTSDKRDDPDTLGEKGIGRLSTQRLGKTVLVETVSENILSTLYLDWDKIISGDNDVEIHDCYSATKSYTRIWIFDINLNDFLNDVDQLTLDTEDVITVNDELRNAITFLISPFDHFYKNEKRRTAPPISMYYNDEMLFPKFDMSLLQCAESRHYFRVHTNKDTKELNIEYGLDIQPWYVERMHRVLSSSPQVFNQLRQKHMYYADFVKKYETRINNSLHHTLSESELEDIIVNVLERQSRKKKLTQEQKDSIRAKAIQCIKHVKAILPAESQIYTFKQNIDIGEKIILESVREQQGVKFTLDHLKSFLSHTNGVKLYRDVFRIGFLGNKENDWLKLQQYRTKGQQFYRFDLGNTLGYVSINDPEQNIVREISSRLDLIETRETTAFKMVINIMFNQVFYDLNRTANALIKALLQEDGLLQGDIEKKVKSNADELRKLRKKTEEIKKVAINLERLLQDHTLSADGKQIIISQKAFSSTLTALAKVNMYFDQSAEVQEEAIQVIEDAQLHLNQVNVDMYNNYKLMANGMITEAITHELDSVSRTSIIPDAEMHFGVVKDFVLDNDGVDIYNSHIIPVRNSYRQISKKLSQVADLYNFLEATFIHKGSYDVFEEEVISETVTQVEENLTKKLRDSKINVVCETKDMAWYVPRGVMLHVFYNLFSNSAYWIEQRKRWAVSDNHYVSNEDSDVIRVSSAGKNAIVISDTGTGVIPSMEDVLFEALQSGKSYSERRGMGLYIVQMLLQSFGASIELMNERNDYGHRYKFLITYRKK